MHVHILGICGTFMGSLALLARDLGHTVTGSDTNIYPPMSTQLERAGIPIQQGYVAAHLQPAPDLVIVGNAMSRGNDAVEYMLNEGIPYTSGPQFLSEHVLQYRHVLAVAGTHGKTTTTTMLAWILQYCGLDTGFLIGGVPLVANNSTNGNISNSDSTDSEIGNSKNANEDNARLNKVFAHSSYLGAGNHTNKRAGDNNNPETRQEANQETNQETNQEKGYFVIEADEYDSAFFDKRSKFVHYRPRTAILNNLEFDHADIFKDLEAIQTQFHHMIRMIPSDGQIIMPAHTPSLEDTIAKGCWTPIWRTQIVEDNSHVPVQWQAYLIKDDGSQFDIQYHPIDGESAKGSVSWTMSGRHNVENAMVAVAAAVNVGISVPQACEALSNFAGIKRRMELIANLDVPNKNETINNVLIYDDFAHHPTAIITTLDGAKKKLGNRKVWAIIEPRSNTMKLGIHKDSLALSANTADKVIWYEPAGLEWGLTEVIGSASNITNEQIVINDTQTIIEQAIADIQASSQDTAIIIMSNGGFDNIHQRLIQRFNNI